MRIFECSLVFEFPLTFVNLCPVSLTFSYSLNLPEKFLDLKITDVSRDFKWLANLQNNFGHILAKYTCLLNREIL